VIRVVILANGMAMRVGLRQVIGGLPGVEIVEEANTPVNLPQAELWVLASAELLPTGEDHPALLLLSENPADALRLVRYPLWGILPLETGETELAAAIQALSEGLCVGAPALLGELISRRTLTEIDAEGTIAQPLTGRETEVLQLAAEGLANKQIALALGISEHTVKFHLSSIYTRLGVTSRTEAVRQGVRNGLVSL
jgi:DNA-binding NarL/FixJ family response regulator